MAPKQFNHPDLVRKMAENLMAAWPDVEAQKTRTTADGILPPLPEHVFYASVGWTIQFVTEITKLVPTHQAPGMLAALSEAASKLGKGVETDTPRTPLEVAEVHARRVGRVLKDGMPPGWGYVLALASLGEGGHLTYLSSLERPGAVNLLRELATIVESGEKSL